MKIEMIKSKYTHNLKRTGCVLIRLINETLKWFPFNLVMAPVIFFILLLIVSSLILFMNGNSQTCQKKCFLFGYI